MSVFWYAFFISIALGGIHHWIKNKSYIFNREDVARIAKRYVGRDKNIQETFTQIAREFERKYHSHILPEEIREWIFLNAGGWMGSVCILHASLTEYVLFFGAAVDTQGHSGRYWVNISDTILTGTFRQWKEASLNSQLYHPGDTVVHLWGEASAVQWTAGTWMVEYGRGFLPSTLGFALFDSVFSTMDFVSIFKLLKMYSRALFQEAMLQLFEVIEMLKK